MSSNNDQYDNRSCLECACPNNWTAIILENARMKSQIKKLKEEIKKVTASNREIVRKKMEHGDVLQKNKYLEKQNNRLKQENEMLKQENERLKEQIKQKVQDDPSFKRLLEEHIELNKQKDFLKKIGKNLNFKKLDQIRENFKKVVDKNVLNQEPCNNSIENGLNQSI